jgi:chitinase
MMKRTTMSLKKTFSTCIIFLLLKISVHAQFPSPALIGYWHNWNDVNAPYIPLSNVDSRYNVIQIAFAIPEQGTDYKMMFMPDQVSQAVFISQVQTLQSQGKKVLISIGGATAPVSLDNISERDTFIARMNQILNTYGFDGMDIDLEGSSVTVSGGSIATPTDAKIINLIDAVKQIMHNYYTTHGKQLLLTMAPETAFVQGGMSAYGGIWGAYLPVIHALRDSLAAIYVQLYNSGSMFGIDGNIYTQGTTDFIIAMTEAVIHGFNTSGGMFYGLQADKVAVGLPACALAAGGGYVSPDSVKAAVNYLRGAGPKPGTYTLVQSGGYLNLRGMMTWSVNWDAVSNCASAYQYAQTFEDIFSSPSAINNWNDGRTSVLIYPNPFTDVLFVNTSESASENLISIYNAQGTLVLSRKIHSGNAEINLSSFPAGLYGVRLNNSVVKLIKH